MKDPLHILRVPFHRTTLTEAVHTLNQAAEKKTSGFFCVTPNPEICLQAFRNPSYLRLLQSADLSIPDGFGILWASRYLKGSKNFVRWLWTLLTPWMTLKESPLPERVTGTDVMRRFLADFPQRKVFLLGASDAVNEGLAKRLKSSRVQVVGNVSGSPAPENDRALRKMVDGSDAEVLFVAYGAPKQEQWISRNLPHLKSVRVAMGVGGAFDFLSGHRKRAPAWMRSFGLEWLYRLWVEPKRLKRIINATLVFPWVVYRHSR